MEDIKKVLITGITGNQGGALACHLKNKNVQMYGMTRNVKSKKAKDLESHGITIIEANLDDPSSYKGSLKDMDTVFCVQSFEQGKASEIRQGKQFIENVKSSGVKHLVYSSVLGADLNTGVPHFESKFELENYIKDSDLTYTILRPASFNENYLNPEITKRLQKGKLVMPLNKTVIQQLISTDDIGKVATKVITEPEKYKNKTLSLATDQKEMTEVAKLFGEVMNRDIKYQKLPGFITRLLMGKDLHKMFRFMNKHNFVVVKDITAIKEEFGLDGNLKNWIADNFSN